MYYNYVDCVIGDTDTYYDVYIVFTSKYFDVVESSPNILLGEPFIINGEQYSPIDFVAIFKNLLEAYEKDKGKLLRSRIFDVVSEHIFVEMITLDTFNSLVSGKHDKLDEYISDRMEQDFSMFLAISGSRKEFTCGVSIPPILFDETAKNRVVTLLKSFDVTSYSEYSAFFTTILSDPTIKPLSEYSAFNPQIAILSTDNITNYDLNKMAEIQHSVLVTALPDSLLRTLTHYIPADLSERRLS